MEEIGIKFRTSCFDTMLIIDCPKSLTLFIEILDWDGVFQQTVGPLNSPRLVPVVGIKMCVRSLWSLCYQSLFCSFLGHQEGLFMKIFIWITPMQ